MFDEGQLCSWMQLLEVYLIHEGANEKDAATGASQKVFRSQGIGKCAGIKALTLICDANDERVAGIFERCSDALVRIIGIAMEYGIDSGFANGHCDLE